VRLGRGSRVKVLTFGVRGWGLGDSGSGLVQDWGRRGLPSAVVRSECVEGQGLRVEG
jgi:hypothetical protein